jgi:carbon-monoxide dehydrogenase catalytic subunit
MEKPSVHETINEMYQKVREEGISNVADRYEAQSKKCTFCVRGLSCQLCSMGPCRITEQAPYGACGIDANGIAMRNMLHRNIMGTAAYSYHAVEAAKTLKATALGKTPFKINAPEKLIAFAQALGIETEGRDINDVAVDVADFVIADLNRDADEPSKLVEIFAPEQRKKLWKELGIFPGGVLHEMMVNAASSMTNVDSNYVSLALKAMRMGIATAFQAQLSLEIIQDVLFGVPKPHKGYVDLGIIDPEYVNIAVNGHEPFVGAALIELAKSEEVQAKAREAGAKGLKIVGSIETGQELLQRYNVDDVFVGLTGNWITQEYVLATGAIDVFAMDMNCSLPNLADYAEKYGVTLVPVSKLVRMRGVDKGLDYKPELVKEQAEELINIAIENFKKRKGKPTRVPKRKQEAIVGFSIESILDALGGSLDPLLEAIKSGDIKGVVALVSCTTLRNGPHDENTVTIAKELIKRDILVLSMGCGNAAVQVAGLTSLEAQELAGERLKKVLKALNIPPVLSFGTCTDTGRLAQLVTALTNALGVDTAQLPIAATAPEYMEQKATIDAIFAVALGVYTHVAPLPPVTGAPELVKLLTEDVESITGGKLAPECDPIEAVDWIEKHIMKRREELGI